MAFRERHLIGGAIALATALLSFAVFGRVPEEMVTHWGPDGPDGTMERTTALIGLPALASGTLFLFEVVPRIDPLGEHVRDLGRYYDAMVVVTVGLVGYVHVLVVLWNVGYTFDVTQAIAPAVAVVLYVAGVVMDRVERNWFVGVRTPWTLSSEAVWDRTNERAGPLFKVAGVLAFGAAVLPEFAIVFLVGPVLLVAVYLTVYSYVAYNRLPEAADGAAQDDNV